MNRKWVLGAIVGVVAASALAMAQQDRLYRPAGEKAPNFKTVDTAGKSHTLSGLTESGPVFVVFWKQQCPHNPKASKFFNALAEAYKGKANLVGIVNADVDGAKKWQSQFGVNYPFATDPGNKIIGDYELKFSITTFMIDGQGKIQKVFAGYSEDVLNQLNDAMASVAKTPKANLDFSSAPKRTTFGCGY